MTRHPVPKRVSLVSQTIELLEAGVKGGRWIGELPAQHVLCDELMISRKTLRHSLQDLAARGLIDVRQGRATLVRHQSPLPPPRRLREVVLLLPQPLWQLRPSVGRWASELRSLLIMAGLELIVCESDRYYRSNSSRHLAKLVRTHPDAAWVLFTSTRGMQQWFAAHGPPAILVGSLFAGINLPSIEYDHAAIAQHAATKLAAAGHERTAILLQRTGSAADDTTVESFGAWRRPGTNPPLLLEHDGSLGQITAQLRRMAALRDRPTGLLVTKSLAVIPTFTVLPRFGIEIPRDLSVVCREDDSFLDYLVPGVARYRSDSAAIARKLARALSQLASGHSLPVTHERLMPQFVPGESIALARVPPR